MKKVELTQERLKELLSYDPETGVFRWRAAHRGIRAGAIAGSSNGNGYRRIGVDSQKYFSHRLAWLYVYGHFPVEELDHKFGDSQDNRVLYLREATSMQNHQNVKGHRDNSSGIKGVSWHHHTKKWLARIMANGKPTYLGIYPTKEEAKRIYDAKAKELFGEFRRVG